MSSIYNTTENTEGAPAYEQAEERFEEVLSKMDKPDGTTYQERIYGLDTIAEFYESKADLLEAQLHAGVMGKAVETIIQAEVQVDRDLASIAIDGWQNPGSGREDYARWALKHPLKYDLYPLLKNEESKKYLVNLL